MASNKVYAEVGRL